MFGCSFVQVPSIYCISSAGDTLLRLSAKDIDAPLPSCVVLRIREGHPPHDYIPRRARLTELLGIILGFEEASILLDSPCLIWPLHS